MSDIDGLPEAYPLAPGLGIGSDSRVLWEIESGRKLLYRQAYFEICETVTGRAPSDEPPDEAQFIEMVLAYMEENRLALHRRICEEFKWCEVKENFGTSMIFIPLFLQLVFLVSDLIGGGVATAGWMATAGLLNRFCKC